MTRNRHFLLCYCRRMHQTFADMLVEDGKKNSLGRVPEIIEIVLSDKSKLDELYAAIFHDDAWARMRAIDAFEKVCRVHPEWIKPYIDKIQIDLSTSTQASIQWHIAQLYRQVELEQRQKDHAIEWLKNILSYEQADWIVVANSMATLAYFVHQGTAAKSDLLNALTVQKNHKSKAVVKRVSELLSEFSSNTSAITTQEK